MIIVAFRGSNDIKNWLAFNLDARMTSFDEPGCNNCKVMEGFLNSYLTFNDNLNPIVRELKQKYPTAEVLLTGHSLGGSLATFAAMDLETNVCDVDYFYTFE